MSSFIWSCVCCFIYIFSFFGTVFENRVALNPGLGGMRDVASDIISHEQIQ